MRSGPRVIELDCEAICFDSDGVLVDSDASVIRAWSQWARSRGLDPDVVVPMVHGRKSRETVALLVPEPERVAALAAIDAWELDDAAQVTALPGAVDFTGSVPVGCWSIVTSATRALGVARLAAAGVRLPSVLVTADDVSEGKPHPEGYLAACAALGCAARQAIVIEDSATGILAARAAGVRWVVGVGERALETDADVVVNDLREICWTGHGVRVVSGLRGV
jgi:sugar-phosphatase